MMNDEQFEAVLDFIRRNWNSGGSPVADLRARDTAQREALARVEAEHADDVQRYRQLLNEAGRDRYAAQKTLAEAVGLLHEFAAAQEAKRQGVGNAQRAAGISRLVVAEERVVAFLAQAEQQEARNAEVARESLRLENQRIEPVEPLRVPHPLEAQGAHAEGFKREQRYMVIKLSKLADDQGVGMSRREQIYRIAHFGYAMVECVVVESDWPEYEPTWAAIQARVIFAERRQVRDASEEEKQAIADRLKGLPPALRGNDHDQ